MPGLGAKCVWHWETRRRKRGVLLVRGISGCFAEGCPARLSHKNALHERPTRVPYSVPRQEHPLKECHTRVQTSVSNYVCLTDCPTRVSHNTVLISWKTTRPTISHLLCLGISTVVIMIRTITIITMTVIIIITIIIVALCQLRLCFRATLYAEYICSLQVCSSRAAASDVAVLHLLF